MNEVQMELAGEPVVLSSGKALFWPRGEKLFVADAHFGKAAAFRIRGVPVPRGTTHDNLARLDVLLARFRPRTLVFLGDFLHARESRTASTTAAISSWRAQHGDLRVLLVRGNHDAHAGDPAPELGIQVVNAPHPDGPFDYCHQASERASGYALAGHLHPAWVLHGRARESLRLPCFWLTETHVVLPAFGAFTGTLTIAREMGERVFVVAGDRIFEA